MKERKKERTHQSVSIPTDLIEEGKKTITNPYYKGGYRSFSELTTDAVRRRIEEIKKEINEAQRLRDLFELTQKKH